MDETAALQKWIEESSNIVFFGGAGVSTESGIPDFRSTDGLYNHMALAKLEREGKVKAVVTQNIDGLHQAAGSREVLELHGSVHRNYCTRCGRFYSLDDILKADGVPVCDCGGVIKPDVVLYEEGLDQDVIQRSVEYISRADVLIIGGTSLTVYPAAGLIDYYRGSKLVLINKSVTSRDGQADLVICDSIGKVLGDAAGPD